MGGVDCLDVAGEVNAGTMGLLQLVLTIIEVGEAIFAIVCRDILVLVLGGTDRVTVLTDFDVGTAMKGVTFDDVLNKEVTTT